VNTTANQTRRIVLLLVCHTVAVAQPADLTPLWPPVTPSSDPIRHAIQSGQMARAATLIAALDPFTRNLWQGILAITQNDSTGAIRALRKGNYPKALGVAYYLAGQHLLFREQMAEAIRRDPDDFGPYYYLGRHYDSDVDNAEEAARWFRLALERNPEYASARSHLGNCLERLGKTVEAQAAYKASSTVALSQVGLARLHLADGDAVSALTFVQKAIGLDSRNVSALKLAAQMYGRLNRHRDSVEALESAAALAPRDPSIQYQLARAYQSLGDSAKSAAALRNFERLRAIYGLNR
jgi:tetratricopeptide (TPR) repeat protein